MPHAKKPVRVAVVGGGCAALTTAYELTKPEHEGLYEVTVYQMGWRLGGKGASGRGPSDRIEEHGLHLWMSRDAWRDSRTRFRRRRTSPSPIGSRARTIGTSGWPISPPGEAYPVTPPTRWGR